MSAYCAKCGADVLGVRKGVPLKYCSKTCRYACGVGRKPLPAEERAARKAKSNRAWREANADQIRARKTEWNRANPGILSERNRRKKYGMSAEACADMLSAQSGGCAVCALPIVLVGEKNAPNLAHVDHDHVTEAARGLLCRSCNLAIGHMKDSPLRLRMAAAYLDRHRPKLRVVR